MKKFIILILFVLTLSTGCYDYTEINDMAIVSGISVDYEEDKFQVAFEILNTINKEDSAQMAKVYVVKGEGSSLSEAFSSASLEIDKMPYLAHLKTLVINEEVAKEHVEEIIDFLLRDNHIRNVFYLAIAKDTTAYEVLTNTDTNNPVASTAIAKLIDNNIFSNSIAADLNFEKFMVNILDPRKDTYASSIVIENDVLKLGPIAIFKKYNMQSYLTETESATFNVMNGDSKEIHFIVDCPNNKNNFITLSTFSKPKSKIEIEDKTVTISTEVEIRVIENHCKMDFKKVETYENIQKQVEKTLEKDMEDVVKKAIKYESDILKINQTYYQKYKKEIDFTTLNYKYKASAIINRNGLIFEVEE